MELLKNDSLSIYKALFDCCVDALSVIDPETGKFVFCNDAAVRLHGMGSRERFLGCTPADISPERQPGGELSSVLSMQHVRHAFSAGADTFEWTHRKLDGAEFPSLVTLCTVEIDGRNHVMAIGRDISAQKRAEEKLREAKERLDAAASAGIVGVWDSDLRRNTLCWDKVMYRLYGLDTASGEVDYQLWVSTLHPEDRARLEAEVQAALRGERELSSEFRIVWPDGSVHHLKVASHTRFDETGRAQRMVGVSYDITEQKNVEERLQQGIARATQDLKLARDAAEAASEAKSVFLANMSHELSTPMNVIMGMAYILQGTELTPRQKGLLSKLQVASKHLQALLNDILDHVRISAETRTAEHRTFQPQAVLDRIASEIREGALAKGLGLFVEVDAAVPRSLEGEEDLIAQVLRKLADNAVKFTEKGQVRLGLRLVEQQGEAVVLRFEVCDTGIGLAAEEQERLLNCSGFQQADMSLSRKYGGIGLGLATARRLVERLGGELGVESCKGEGSRFWFSVKLAASPAAPAVLRVPNPAGTPGTTEPCSDQDRTTAAANPSGGDPVQATTRGDPPYDRAALAAVCAELLQLLAEDDLAARQVLKAHLGLLQAAFQASLQPIEAALDQFDFPFARAALEEVMARCGLARNRS